MKTKNQIIRICFAVAILSSVLFCLVSFYRVSVMKKVYLQQQTKYINAILYNTSVTLDIFEHYKKEYGRDEILEDKLLHLITNDIFQVSLANIQFESLKSVPLETLYRLVRMKKNHEFQILDEQKFARVPLDYLDTIENDVIKIVEKRKDIRKSIFEGEKPEGDRHL